MVRIHFSLLLSETLLLAEKIYRMDFLLSAMCRLKVVLCDSSEYLSLVWIGPLEKMAPFQDFMSRFLKLNRKSYIKFPVPFKV